MDKQTIRQMMIQKRNLLTIDEVNTRSQLLINKLLVDQRFINSHLVAIYEPINNEVDLRSIYQSGKRIALPRVDGPHLHFIETTPNTKLIRSPFGILEPSDGLIVDDEIDLLLVPSLALDKNNYRVGFGKGYYDRFLAKHKPAIALGVIYDFQLLDHFPHHELDIALDGMLIA